MRLILMNRIVIISIFCLFLIGTAQAATFTVNVTGDASDAHPGDGVCSTNAGNCSLRAAIEEANATAATDTIAFDIAGTGVVKTIDILSPLPFITQPVIIDGRTQPGFVDMPIIELNGAGASGVSTDGLHITSGGCTVRGLVIGGFIEDGIDLDGGDGNTIVGNFIGTNATGTIARGNTGCGIVIRESGDNRIGGTGALGRNLISANGRGIGIGDSIVEFNNRIVNNYIGTDITGNNALGNTYEGIHITDSTLTIIGGASPDSGNLISGNGGTGIAFVHANLNEVKSNLIGTKSDGTGNLGNGGLFGITVLGFGNQIGSPNSGNTIAFNAGHGVVVQGSNDDTGNSVRGNSIFANDQLGINVSHSPQLDNGVDLNDTGDADTGPNNGQNYPVLTSATGVPSGATVTGLLNSTPQTDFKIDFYSSPSCDSSGHGEGKLYLGATTVTTDAGGNAQFVYAAAGDLPDGRSITATATRDVEPFDTSEFSACIAVGSTAAEMEVRFVAVGIADGDTTPSLVEGTDFGTADGHANERVTRTFTIANTGQSYLNLTDSPSVAVTGTYAQYFRITAQPAARSLAPGENTTFSIEFHPTGDAVYNASVVIGNSDENENPYNFDIRGTGLTAPTRQMRIIGGTTRPTQPVAVSVQLTSLGDENAVGFSINFDQTVLMNPSVALGTDAASSSLFVNDTQAANGKIGIVLALPAGTSFPAGTRSLITVTFNTSATAATSSPVTFGDIPVVREVVGPGASTLPANYYNGSVQFTQGWEADVAPRPTGTNNGTVSTADLTQVGRFAAALDTDYQSNEFQRADCAPLDTLGDGMVTVSDYMQAGRYAAALDPVNPMGGPTSRMSEKAASVLGSKLNPNAWLLAPSVLRVVNQTAVANTQAMVAIEVDARGAEGGFGFTLNYDSTKLTNPLVAIGSGVPVNSTLIPNATQAGKVGVILGLPIGVGLTAGAKQLVTIRFNVVSNAPTGPTLLTLGDTPVFREVADVNANPVSSTFQGGSINIVAPTAALVSVAGRVRTSLGNGINGAVVTLNGGGLPQPIRILSSSFGYYRFDNVPVGGTYVLTVGSKRYTFTNPSVVISLLDELTDADFVAIE